MGGKAGRDRRYGGTDVIPSSEGSPRDTSAKPELGHSLHSGFPEVIMAIFCGEPLEFRRRLFTYRPFPLPRYLPPSYPSGTARSTRPKGAGP
jgi:hypothetical protein